MSNELVKYDPELNTIPLRNFTPVEMNLFFSIISRMRDQGNKTVRFSFDQLKELSNYKPTANKRFIDDIENTYQKEQHLLRDLGIFYIPRISLKNAVLFHN